MTDREATDKVVHLMVEMSQDSRFLEASVLASLGAAILVGHQKVLSEHTQQYSRAFEGKPAEPGEN